MHWFQFALLQVTIIGCTMALYYKLGLLERPQQSSVVTDP